MTVDTTKRTIVVGYDGSPAARIAVDHAILRASPHGRLVVVHAYLAPTDHVGSLYSNPMLEESAKQASDLLDALEADCPHLAAVVYERDIAVGPAALAITRAAEAREADEIVVGSRGVGRLKALLGSVAHDVLHRAHCPVTVIPERMVESATPAPATASSSV